jgi:medium-chain acyl-[acyl-carrier-protein] hydrolase
VQNRYAGIPDAVFREPELMQLFLPMLRADFRAYETYECADERPLECPITAFTGEQDPIVKLDAVEQWSTHTRRRFASHTLPGDHFFLNISRSQLLQTLREDLMASSQKHLQDAISSGVDEVRT